MNDKIKLEVGDILERILLFAMLAIAVGGGCSYINKKLDLEPDNPLEEYIEDIIEEKTGIEIDFTP